jgi:xanthine dehydrogenase YagT iron-sulfur-binding subunit
VSGHLCRCGTYPNIFKATLAAAAAVRGNKEDNQ